MRTIILVGVIIVALVIGKLFIFSKPGKEAAEKKGTGANAAKPVGAVPVNVFIVGRETI